MGIRFSGLVPIALFAAPPQRHIIDFEDPVSLVQDHFYGVSEPSWIWTIFTRFLGYCLPQKIRIARCSNPLVVD